MGKWPCRTHVEAAKRRCRFAPHPQLRSARNRACSNVRTTVAAGAREPQRGDHRVRARSSVIRLNGPMTRNPIATAKNPISATRREGLRGTRSAKVDLSVLVDVARRTVDQALSRLPARAFDPSDAVYVVMDPRRS